MTAHIPRSDRSEMLRAHAGIVTALVAGDAQARDQQVKAIVVDHAEKSGGDMGLFAGRMGKQVEAGARVTQTVLRMLAKRLDLTDEETQAVIAQAIASIDDDLMPE